MKCARSRRCRAPYQIRCCGERSGLYARSESSRLKTRSSPMQQKLNVWWRVVASLSLAVALNLFSAQALARVTRIVIDEKSPAYDGKIFGAAGAYERITGHAFGELDPQDPH